MRQINGDPIIQFFPKRVTTVDNKTIMPIALTSVFQNVTLLLEGVVSK